MKIVQGLSKWCSREPVGSVALGYFDGVHIGHRDIIATTVEEARKRSLPSVVLSFEPHPLAIINPGAAPKLITPLNEKIKLIESLGVDVFLILPFTPALAATKPSTFVRMVLAETLRTKHVTVGYDYTFGHLGEGTSKNLAHWSQELGFKVTIVPPVTVNNKTVSSTLIRQLVSQGEVVHAKAALGRWPSVSGRVTHGAKRGRSFGFPTANIPLRKGLQWPRFGVYAVRSWYQDRHLLGMANIGSVPTFGEHTARLEANFFDFQDNLYEKSLRVELLAFIRPERKFVSSEELRNQLEADKQEALRFFPYTGVKMQPDCPSLVYNGEAL